MQDAACRSLQSPLPRQEQLRYLRMSVSIVDEDGQPVAGRTVQLAGHGVALNVRRGEVAEEIEPDLAHRDAARIRDQTLQLLPRPLVSLRGVMGVHAHGGLDQRRMTRGELERGRRRREIPAGYEDALDPRLHGALQHALAIGIEALVL